MEFFDIAIKLGPISLFLIMCIPIFFLSFTSNRKTYLKLELILTSIYACLFYLFIWYFVSIMNANKDIGFGIIFVVLFGAVICIYPLFLQMLISQIRHLKIYAPSKLKEIRKKSLIYSALAIPLVFIPVLNLITFVVFLFYPAYYLGLTIYDLSHYPKANS